MAQAWPSAKAMCSSRQASASQYQQCLHSQPTTRPSRNGATALRKGSGGGGQVAGEALLSVAVEDAEEQGPGVEIDAGVESGVGGGQEAAHGEGLRLGWCDGRRLGAPSIIAAEGLHEYPGAAADRAGITAFRDMTFLAAGPASERSRSADFI
jgi:hypothetical protein